MLVELSSDQEALRDTTARYLDNEMPVDRVRGLRDDPAGYEPAYWAKGAELGWTSLLVSEEHGGGTVSGFALQDFALVAHEFGAHAAPGPLVPVNVVASALDAVGSPAQRAHIDELIAGTAIATWCFGEPVPHDRFDEGTLEIRPEGSELVISGVKRPVESAAQADHLLVTGRTADGRSQVLVPADTPGVSIQPLDTVDLTRRFSIVTFTDVRVPLDAAVGDLGAAAGQIERQAQLAILAHNAEAIGAMQRAFGMTKDWAFDRYSFGRPLASYQEIKHRFADLLSWLEASHAINDAAIAAFDAGAPGTAELVSAAKAYVGEQGSELAQDCVQLHGGIGVTFEHDLHLYLRRIILNRTLYGTPAEHRRRVGGLLVDTSRTDRGEQQ